MINPVLQNQIHHAYLSFVLLTLPNVSMAKRELLPVSTFDANRPWPLSLELI
jgi:hypothetical protein